MNKNLNKHCASTFTNNSSTLTISPLNSQASTLSQSPLHPWYVSGFVDGDGSFTISITKNKLKTEGWLAGARFAVELSKSDALLLYKLKSYFGVGTIIENSINGTLIYSVQSIKALVNVILPHFTKYPLKTQKQGDLLLFKAAVELISKKEHLNMEGLTKVVSIKGSLNKGLSPALVECFPNVIPFERPLVQLSENIDPNWLVGFVDAEGCFSVSIVGSKTYKNGYQTRAWFILTQHSRDFELMSSLVSYLGCGNLEGFGSDVIRLKVTKFSEIKDKIVPFFDKYKLESKKKLDYLDFCKVVELIDQKAHLTELGLEQCLKIRERMNSKREYDSSDF